MFHGKFHDCVWNESLTKVMITLQEAMLPSTHSRSPTGLIPHPWDKQELETAAGRETEGKTCKRKTMIRWGRWQWKTDEMQEICSLSIRRISLLPPPAAGGEHLPYHSQTTLASTLPSGESEFVNILLMWDRLMNVCVRFGSQVRVQHSPKGGLPWLVHHEPRVYWQAGSGLVRTTKHDFWVIVCNIRNQLACELPGNKCLTQQSHLLASGSLVTRQPAHLWLWNIINSDKHYNNVRNFTDSDQS